MRAFKCVMHLSLVSNGEDDTVNDSFCRSKKKTVSTRINRRNYYKHFMGERQEKEEKKKKKQLNDMIKMTPNAISMVPCM